MGIYFLFFRAEGIRRLPAFAFGKRGKEEAAFVFYGAVRGFFGWDRRPADMPAGSSGRGKRPQRRQRGVVSHRKKAIVSFISIPYRFEFLQATIRKFLPCSQKCYKYLWWLFLYFGIYQHFRIIRCAFSSFCALCVRTKRFPARLRAFFGGVAAREKNRFPRRASLSRRLTNGRRRSTIRQK